jgi:hypothetical protein
MRALILLIVAAVSVLGDPHSYWRVYITTNGGHAAIAIAELQFYDASGALLSSGGTPLATSTYSGSAASNAFDGNFTTYWASNNQKPAGLGYQFSSSVDVVTVRLVPREDLFTQAPKTLTVQYSDDGSSWVDATALLSTPTWSTQQMYSASWPVATPFIGAATMWRIKSNATVEGATSCGTLEFRTVVGGPQRATSTKEYSITSSVWTGMPPQQAYDGNTATFWGSSQELGWVGYVFSNPVKISQVLWTARSDVNGGRQSPTDFDLQSSNDGGNVWTTVQHFTTLSWTDGETRSFTVSTKAPSRRIRRY